MPIPINIFNQLLISIYQHAKKYAFSLFFSRDIVDLDIVDIVDWLRAFWPISEESDFSQIWDLCKKTENNINFCYRSDSKKIND